MRDSTGSTLRVDPRIIIALAALVAVLFYLMVCARTFRLGFPLDDTWIHLTYARNFAEHGEWAFRLGDRSAGSTAPLWTLLLAIGYFLNLAPYLWTYFLGWVLLTLLGIHAEQTAKQLIPSYNPPVPWVGLFFVVAWHLTWSAVSGMETLLHAYLAFIVLTLLMSGSRRYLALGLLAGLSIWVRPDGLTLLGPLLVTAVLAEKNNRLRTEAIARIGIGFGALFVPYLLFNLALSGNPFPNTFYAKQAEYQAYWQSQPLAFRLTEYLWPVLASPFLVLIPGAILWLRRTIATRNWGTMAGLIWCLGYIAIYFTRLPAYQHGRYIIPVLPVLYIWGLLGMTGYVLSGRSNKLVGFTWQALLVTISLAFNVIGARQNAQDVQWVESEIVETAKWVQVNLPPDALIAAHDIGAIGYFDRHSIIDLAGLVSPDVVDFIRDPEQLSAYLDERGVDYLVTFPSFYPQLVTRQEVVFSRFGSCAPSAGEENMCVFRWK